jgi:hypothetical protein
MNLDDARRLVSDPDWSRTAPHDEWYPRYITVQEHNIRREHATADGAQAGRLSGGHPGDIAAGASGVTAQTEHGTRDHPDG